MLGSSVIALLLVSLSACASLGPSPQLGGVLLQGFDFSPYSAKGFLFTPESYNGQYQSVGLIRVVIEPHIVDGTGRGGLRKPGKVYSERKENPNTKNAWYVETVTASEAIDSAYQEAANLGADALTNFDIEEESVVNGWFTYGRLVITGFAIKRN